MRLALIHRPAGRTPITPDLCLWRTCLRDVVFLEEGRAADDPDIFTDEAAYALLLEIVCGLRSPILGETEVQAQFKSFLGSLEPSAHGGLLKVGRQILADTKLVRTEHLQGFGAHSYGYLAKRHVPAGERVVLVGTGALAKDIRTAVTAHHPVDQWGRRPHGDASGTTTLRHFEIRNAAAVPPVDDPATLIVAAPVSDDDLAAVVARYEQLTTAIDLRSADERRAIQKSDRVVTLEDLFAEAASDTPPAVGRLEAARREVLALARAFSRREELRPFGWDDLCA
jgi:glutamyl-tRNA reductase